MTTRKDFVFAAVLLLVCLFGLYEITRTERYYVVYNTYVQNAKGEMVEQDEDKHLEISAVSLEDAKDQIFEIENQLHEDVIVDSVAVQNYVIVKEH